MTLKEVSQFLKMNERTVLRMAQDGTVPAAKIARRWRFDRDQLERWVARKMGGPETVQAGPIVQTSLRSIPVSYLLRDELTNLELLGKTKDAVLAELVHMTVQAGYLQAPDAIMKALRDRESKMSTGIGEGVAFPHPRPALEGLFQEPLVALGRSPDGVDFDSYDGEPVYLFFMICAPDDSAHLRVLAKLNRLLRVKGLIERARKAESKTELRRIFVVAEDNLKSAGRIR